MRRLLLALSLFLSGCAVARPPVPPPTPPSPFRFALKGAWYRPGRASFLAELTDQGSTAQQDAIADMSQNFTAMVGAGMNVAIVSLPDDDDWSSQFGGGAPYDPKNHSRDIAEAEQAILNTADAAGIHIVFVIGSSGYHRVLPNDVDGNPSGAFDYIDQFTPDQRVIGWLMFDECDPSNPTIQAFLAKYWDHFYERYHSATTWVGINTQYTPDYIGVIRPMIDSEKHFFGRRKHKPDVWGLEWFCCQSVSPQAIAGYIHQMVEWMADDVYSVPRYQIAFMSGGSTNSWTTYYPAAIEAIAKEQVAGLFVWDADAYGNTADCISKDTADAFELFTSSFTPDTACKKYAPLDARWHWNDGGAWTLSTDSFVTQYGRYVYTGLTAAGQAIKQEFTIH
jgi:hypothetical protein